MRWIAVVLTSFVLASCITYSRQIEIEQPMRVVVPPSGDACTARCPAGEGRAGCLASCPGARTEWGACTISAPGGPACTSWLVTTTQTLEGQCAGKLELAPDQRVMSCTEDERGGGVKTVGVVVIAILIAIPLLVAGAN